MLQLRSTKLIFSLPFSRATEISSILQTAFVCPLHSRSGVKWSRLSLQKACPGSLKNIFFHLKCHEKFKHISDGYFSRSPVDIFPLAINFLLVRNTRGTRAFGICESVLSTWIKMQAMKTETYISTIDCIWTTFFQIHCQWNCLISFIWFFLWKYHVHKQNYLAKNI